MTDNQFLKVFTQHLRVAEPRRSELLAEMNHHLSELARDQDPALALGDPKILAAAENRTYIGPLHSPLRIGMLILATILFVLGAGVLAETHREFWSRQIPADETWANMAYYYSYLVPLLVALIIGRALARYHRAQSTFFRLWLMMALLATLSGVAHNLIIGAADIDIPDTIGLMVLSSVLTSLLLGTFYAAAAFVGLIGHAAPVSGPSVKFRRWQTSFITITAALLICFLLLTTWTSLAFQPIPHPAIWPVLGLIGFIVYRVIQRLVSTYHSPRSVTE